jgi:hypothetical protein
MIITCLFSSNPVSPAHEIIQVCIDSNRINLLQPTDTKQNNRKTEDVVVVVEEEEE